MKILPRGPETDRGLLKATQQGQVSQGLPLHIWLMSLQYLFYPGAVNSWKDGLPFEYLPLARLSWAPDECPEAHGYQMSRDRASAGGRSLDSIGTHLGS